MGQATRVPRPTGSASPPYTPRRPGAQGRSVRLGGGSVRVGVFCTLDLHPELGDSPAALYARALEEAEAAEAVGLESFWVAEHHFAPYGVGPDPAVLLAAVAARTRRLRLGTATAVLTWRHPIQVAESYAVLDQLSGGRLEFGVGSGYLAYELAGFGVAPEDKRGRFEEALEVVRQAWAGGPVRFEGRYHRCATPPLNVLPAQPGGPPIHVGVTRREAVVPVGARGWRLAFIPYVSLDRWDELRDLVVAYRRAVPPGAVAEVTCACHAYCGEAPWRGPDDPGYAEAEEALQRYLRTRVVPGARYQGRPAPRDFVLFGDAEQLAARLAGFCDLGVDRLLLIVSFGGLAAERVRRSLARLGAVTLSIARTAG
jgi:alkanesulfonate monooxygenase SsuD/methylene tetrahydromethanopterin reductase-like flavin-dependent oxidoreductase (luciferase family)